MTVTEALVEKISALPSVRQQEVLDFAEFLFENERPKTPRRSMQGILSDLNIDLSDADLRQARSDMWRDSERNSDSRSC